MIRDPNASLRGSQLGPRTPESYGGADSTPPPCSFLHRILSATDGVLNLPRSTIHLTFGLHLGIAGHLPSRFLHLAGRILGGTLHTILVHVHLLVSNNGLTMNRAGRMQFRSRSGRGLEYSPAITASAGEEKPVTEQGGSRCRWCRPS